LRFADEAGRLPANSQMSRLEPELFQSVVVGPGPLAIDTLIDVAVHGAKVRLSDDPAWRRRMADAEARLARAVAEGAPTESHNQDKVSMGTIASREALRVCELVGRAVAVHLLVAAQACELRGGVPGRPSIAAAVRAIRALSPALVDDRPLDGDIEAVYQAVAAGELGRLPAAGA
jgi:histidine ammonia-lyase